MSERRDVIVVGGGLSGLAAARLCQEAGLSVTVFDPHCGGRARSDISHGFTFNRGPHALYLGGATERVLAALGVAFRGGPPALGDAFLLDGGIEYPLPATPAMLLRSKYLGLRDKASLSRLFGRLPRLEPRKFSAITVEELLDGTTPRAANVARVGVRTSTYTAELDRLSAEVAIIALRAPGVRYIDGGWQRLVDGLSTGLAIRTETVTSVGSGGIVTDAGEHPARMVIVAAGVPAAVERLTGCSPFDVAGPIQAGCLDLGFAAAPDRQILLSIDEPIYFSSHTPAAVLAPKGGFVGHAAWYVSHGSDVPPEQTRLALERHVRRLGAAADSIVASRYLHRMTVVGALPTASRGGIGGRPAVNAISDDVLIAGDWVGAEGQLADAAFASAETAARRVCARLAR